jgi:flagellar basal-body rod protein FlgB
MGLNLEQAFGLHPAALKLRGERAQILASNLANDSTPGYLARDLDFRARLQALSEEKDIDGDIDGLPAGFDDTELLYRIPSRPSADGNTVELGSEQAEFAQNAADFQASLTFVNMKISGLTAAIDGKG